METDPERILLVDDDRVFRERLARALLRRGFEVEEAGDADAGEIRCAGWRPARVVVDLRMPGRSGLDLVRAVCAGAAPPRVLVLTGYGSIATAVDAVRLGAVGYLQKPADADEVIAAFDRGAAPPLSTTDDYQAPSLARAEWEHISRVLNDCGGNVSEAARRLGLHRRTLQRKLQTRPPKS
jgi:two-component system response regulator RegA